MNTDKILVCLYSDANFLALSILENLLTKNCYVLIVTDEVSKWENQTIHINSKSRFSFVKPKDISQVLYFNYTIFCGGFIERENAYPEYRVFRENDNIVSPKNLVIFPFESFSLKEDASINVNSNLGVVYIGDLLGPRIDLNSDLLLPKIINRILHKREIRVAFGEVFYPLFVADVAKTITKWLFSFGPYGKSLFLISSQISTSEFYNANQKIFGLINLKEDKETDRRFIPRNYEVKSIPSNLTPSLYETYKWLSSINWSDQPLLKEKRIKKYPKYITPVVITVIMILVLPFILIILSILTSFVSYQDVKVGRYESTAQKLFISRTLFSAVATESKSLSYLPLIGLIYKETNFIGTVGIRVTDLATTIIPAIESSSELFNKVLSDEVYDPTRYSQEISSDLAAASDIVSVFQGELQQSKTLSAEFLLKKIDVDRLGLYFKEGKEMVDNLPGLLGAGGKKTYLLLFQNNMELRPTGGFIGSFGLLSFDGGRMSELIVNDVYSADGQLRGHVEPPTPIKNYLGEANWWLRDSNWDPDFPTTAQRAEWFLDKEMDQKVDGVFGIDLNVVKDTLKLTGPIFLPDYNLSITSDNLYEKTQAEAEEEFFPGSHQKRSFITALSRSLVSQIENLGRDKKLPLLYDLIQNFSKRHIQAFLHNNELQDSFSALGWAGAVENPSCGDGCYADLVGITEANVGVNKANYFVDRKIELKVVVKPNEIDRSLTLNLRNKANGALGTPAKYKVYVRIFVPQDSNILKVKRVTGDYEEDLEPEIFDTHGRHEVGVITEVLAGNNQKIVFDWQTRSDDQTNTGTYGLYVRKQAGVTDDPWEINIYSREAGLTEGGAYTYNTILTRDFVTRVPR